MRGDTVWGKNGLQGQPTGRRADQGKDKRHGSAQVNTQGHHILKVIGWENDGADFCDFFATAGAWLNYWNFRSPLAWLGWRAWVVVLFLERRQVYNSGADCTICGSAKAHRERFFIPFGAHL